MQLIPTAYLNKSAIFFEPIEELLTSIFEGLPFPVEVVGKDKHGATRYKGSTVVFNKIVELALEAAKLDVRKSFDLGGITVKPDAYPEIASLRTSFEIELGNHSRCADDCIKATGEFNHEVIDAAVVVTFSNKTLKRYFSTGYANPELFLKKCKLMGNYRAPTLVISVEPSVNDFVFLKDFGLERSQIKRGANSELTDRIAREILSTWKPSD